MYQLHNSVSVTYMGKVRMGMKNLQKVLKRIWYFRCQRMGAWKYDKQRKVC